MFERLVQTKPFAYFEMYALKTCFSFKIDLRNSNKFRFDWYFGQEELIGDELNRMNGVFISVVDPFTR
jgi:hypothetical protein